VNQLRYRGLVHDRVANGLKMNGHDINVAFLQPEDAAKAVWGWLIPNVPLPEATQKVLVDYMKTDAPKDANRDFYLNRAGSLVELVVTCPEYQLA
jgi:hypothetical protein